VRQNPQRQGLTLQAVLVVRGTSTAGRRRAPLKIFPLQGRIIVKTAAIKHDAYTPSQVSAVTGLSLPAVHKAIEYKLIRPKRIREGHFVHRCLSRSQAIYLRMEAKGLRSLPLAARRQVARAVDRYPGIDAMFISEGSVILVQCKSARKEVETGFRRLGKAMRMVQSDPEIMRGAPVYKGTRIPIHAIADMLSQGAAVAEILEGYPALTREKVELTPLYVKAFPRGGALSCEPGPNVRRDAIANSTSRVDEVPDRRVPSHVARHPGA
jgi:uncharacterized protein (DUF433 family)